MLKTILTNCIFFTLICEQLTFFVHLGSVLYFFYDLQISCCYHVMALIACAKLKPVWRSQNPVSPLEKMTTLLGTSKSHPLRKSGLYLRSMFEVLFFSKLKKNYFGAKTSKVESNASNSYFIFILKLKMLKVDTWQ